MQLNSTKKSLITKFNLSTNFIFYFSNGSCFLQEEFTDSESIELMSEETAIAHAFLEFRKKNIGVKFYLNNQLNNRFNRFKTFCNRSFKMFDGIKDTVKVYQDQYDIAKSNLKLTIEEFEHTLFKNYIPDNIKVNSDLNIGDNCYYVYGIEDSEFDYIYRVIIKELTIKGVTVRDSSCYGHYDLEFSLNNQTRLCSSRRINDTDEIRTGSSNTFMYLNKSSAINKRDFIIDKINELNKKS